MYLKTDFEAALQAAVLTRPAAAAAFRAGDPRLLAQMDAITTMLAMISQQVDVAEVEPFIKARTGTVLADAALKGVLPLGRPAKVQIAVSNPGATPVTIATGRTLLDGKGRRYTVDGAATVPASSSANITARQATSREVTHTVAGSVPFYEVRIPDSEDGGFIAGVDVADASGAFTYTPDFCNVQPGDRVFHIETDEYRRMVLRFGASDAAGAVVGHQPANGSVLTITISECGGAVDLEVGAAFAIEYTASPEEAELSLVLGAVLTTGAKPPDAETLRMLARYPALHDGNAVYLSNFDFLIRRGLSGVPVQFLSVWNEQAEEAARGPSVANINKLFVSYLVPSQSGPTTEAQITAIVQRADDSYRLVFVPYVASPIPVTITASVSVVHDPAAVEAQIRTVMLSEYGVGSVSAARGMTTLRLQMLSQLLQDNVPALQDQISDFKITVGAMAAQKPEDFRHITNGSMTVNVTRVQAATGLWNG